MTGYWKISRPRNLREAQPPAPPEKYDAAEILLNTEVLLGRLSDPARPGRLKINDTYHVFTFRKYRILQGPDDLIRTEGWMADSNHFSETKHPLSFESNGYWVCEDQLTPLSPWHWDGYTCLEELRPPLEYLLSQIHEQGDTPLSQLQHLLQSRS